MLFKNSIFFLIKFKNYNLYLILIYFLKFKNILKLQNNLNFSKQKYTFIKLIPLFYNNSVFYFNTNNIIYFDKIIKFKNNYLFYINLYLFLKIFKNLVNMLYLSFLNNNNLLIFNPNNLLDEINTFYFYTLNYNFLNIYKKLLLLKKKESKNFFIFIVHKLIKKYNINLMLLLDYKNLNFYYNISKNCNLPIIGLQTLKDSNSLIDYPILFSNINIFTKYLVICEISAIYIQSKKDKQKKLLIYFFNLFFKNLI